MNLKNVKMLLVDDDTLLRDTIALTLKRQGAELATAESVETAKKQVEAFGPQIILTDIQMPGGTGIDLLHWVKKNHPAIPVVVMTGFSELSDAASAAQAGAAGFIAKPFKREDLLQILTNLTGRPATESPLGSAGMSSAPAQEDSFVAIRIEDFAQGSQFQMPIYMRLVLDNVPRFFKVAHKGENLSDELIRFFREKGLVSLYVSRADQKA